VSRPILSMKREEVVLFDPHALKIYVDGNCWDNPGGTGGFAVRVEYGCDSDREDRLVEYRGHFETTNNRMELHGCIFAHEWAYENIDELGAQRVLVLTDSEYVFNSYSWAIGWCQNNYCNRDGRPIKNEDLLKDLMTLRRKLARRLRIEVKLIPRRSNDAAKEVDRAAKAAGKMPSHVDWGFRKGKIGRPKNNSKGAARLYPAAGQTPVIRPYKSDVAKRDIQLFKFEVWDEAKGMFFDKFEAYTTTEIGNELHRQNVFHVRMNDVPGYPQILEILATLKESDLSAKRIVAGP
jgi:ribonuclease HI